MGKVGIIDTEEYKTIQVSYPHVADKLFIFWGSKEFSNYVYSLLFDGRNALRKGFPLEIAQALSLLQELHDSHWPEHMWRDNSFWK